jgi:BRCT domain type II-containing protein
MRRNGHVASLPGSVQGCTVVVTGVPAGVSRKDTEALVTKNGGKLTKSISKNTSFVVLGNESGPKKLEKIEELGVETLDVEALFERVGKKRAPVGGDAEPKARKKKRKARSILQIYKRSIPRRISLV